MDNYATDVRTEIFVQADINSTRMFLWMVDREVDPYLGLIHQSSIIRKIDQTAAAVYRNIVNHAHGLETLNDVSSDWLDLFWDNILRVYKGD